VDDTSRDRLSESLYRALRDRAPIAPLTDAHPELTVRDAYLISMGILERRLADGERVVGRKIGLTSKAVQQRLDVHEPDFGHLTDRMEVPDGGHMPISESMIQARAEGELAFRLSADLPGPTVTPDDVLGALGEAYPCFEVVDSRVVDWKVRIQDTIADNASSGMFVLGPGVSPQGIDFEGCEMVVTKNGAELSRGHGRACLGSPLNAVAWLAERMASMGTPLRAGDLILSGSMVPLEPVQAGDTMSMTLSGVGSCSVHFS